MNRKMVVFLQALLILTFCLSTPAAAHLGGGGRNSGNFGIGLGGGTIAHGLSLKQFAGPTAIQGNLGCYREKWSGCSGIAGSVDLLFNMPALTQGPALSLAWNFGGGLGVGLASDKMQAAAAFVLGLEFNFHVLPIDIVIEWRPQLSIIPGVGVHPFGATAHVRLYVF
ncbi:MAG: hypothetical protein H0U74_20845 [Bradymonadaceae bacterium]|nr:hypothetical protein [Lujinxingiaceae bacterium]